MTRYLVYWFWIPPFTLFTTEWWARPSARRISVERKLLHSWVYFDIIAKKYRIFSEKCWFHLLPHSFQPTKIGVFLGFVTVLWFVIHWITINYLPPADFKKYNQTVVYEGIIFIFASLIFHVLHINILLWKKSFSPSRFSWCCWSHRIPNRRHVMSISKRKMNLEVLCKLTVCRYIMLRKTGVRLSFPQTRLLNFLC